MKVEEREGKKKLAEAVASVESTRTQIEEANNRLSIINFDEEGSTHHLQIMLQEKETKQREIELFHDKLKVIKLRNWSIYPI
jgi:hypothetical protein